MPERPTNPTATPPEELALRLEAVSAERDTFRQERDEYRRLYLEMMALNRKLEMGVVGRGRERDLDGDASQLTLSMLEMMTGGTVKPESEPEKKPVRAHERAKPTGRKPLPENLPRVDVTVLPPEVQARGTDAFVQIGEDVTETVERRPGAIVVVRVHKPKFVEKGRDLAREVKVHQAAAPELPIERGLAGPGLLADTIVHRWADHLPLHRLERIYGRDGLELPRATMCDWHLSLAQLLRPLIGAMWKEALTSPWIGVDATGVLVQQEKKCRSAHFFVVVAPELHVLFGFSDKHDAKAVDKLLGDYQGTIVADAHVVYDHLFTDDKVLEAGCWAHVRRYFFKALGTDPPRARHALALIGKLFHIEKALAQVAVEIRLATRLRDSKTVVDELDAWCDAEADKVLDQTPIARAIGYARNHRAAFRRFLEDGRIPIHNNWSERELRREAVGRKNWIFLGSDEGGVTNATFVSTIASCQLHGLDPYTYHRDLFCLLPSWPVTRVLELAPAHWNETVAREDVQRLLTANIYRRASLGEP